MKKIGDNFKVHLIRLSSENVLQWLFSVASLMMWKHRLWPTINIC